MDDVLEEANRVARRESLLEFTRDCIQGFRPAPFIEYMCERLEVFSKRVTECAKTGVPGPRLQIRLPYRHGKSAVNSIAVPAWHMGHNPTHDVLVASHTAGLTVGFSYECRDVMKREWYRDTFPAAALSKDSKNVTGWRLEGGGGYFPVGIHGGFMGKGASLLILDDLYKNEAQARSARIRDEIRERYKVLYTRLHPGAGVLLIMHRWHSDDLPGVLEHRSESGDGEKWEVINFPAIATEDEYHPRTGKLMRNSGEALHPDRYPIETLRTMEKEMGPALFEALAQQNPIPETGDFIKSEWVKRYDRLPPRFDRIVISWDTAFKNSVRSDRVAGQVWGRLGADVYLLHASARQMDFNSVCDEIAAQVKTYLENYPTSLVEALIEERANGMGVIRYLRNVVGLPCVRGFDPMRWGGKEARANVVTGYFRAGHVYVPADDHTKKWVSETVREWLQFPHHKYDDATDAMTQALIYMYRGSQGVGVMRDFRAGVPVNVVDRSRRW